jgi:hypothetical protein
VRFAAKQKPHRPSIAPALGLRAEEDVSSHDRGPCVKHEVLKSNGGVAVPSR